MATIAPRVAPDPPARRTLWRAPVDQPRWTRPALLGITAFAAVLYFWGLGRTGFHGFYGAAARSMTVSWKAFLFGALDPGSSITIDKLPGFLWPQALSARIFGFHAWALDLPEALAGVVTLLVLYRAVRDWFADARGPRAGAVAGVAAAGVFALTPVAASLFREPQEDGLLTMLLTLGAAACARAARTGRLRTLILAGVWVGLAFQAKMVEAWAVLPAFALAYGLAAPHPRLRRLWHLLVAGAVTAAVSLAWMIMVVLVPAADRPYIDGSTSDNPFGMVFGYNGTGRFGSVGVTSAGLGGVTGFGRDGSGWTKLLQHGLASQIGWLYPLALIALVAGVLWRGRAARTDPERAGYLLWGGWAVALGAAFSAGSVPHSHYTVALAPPIAALCGGGLVTLTRAYRAGGRCAWALPCAVAATAVWAVYLASGYSSFLPWLTPIVIALAVVGVVALVAALVVPRRRALAARLGLAAGLLALAATPAAWSLSVLDSTYGGSAMNASAGPYTGGFAGPRFARFVHDYGGFGAAGGLGTSRQRLLDYVTAHSAGVRYVMAVESSVGAAPYITSDAARVLPMGGFTGQVPFPTLDEFRHLVGTGQLRYVLLGGFHGFGGRATGTTATGAITAWVRHTCAPVPGQTALYVCSAAPAT